MGMSFLSGKRSDPAVESMMAAALSSSAKITELYTLNVT